MATERRNISKEDMAAVLDRVVQFRRMHDNIQAMEVAIRDMQDRRDALVTDLSLLRSDEEVMMADMELKYGPGKLDVTTFQWVTTKTTT